jgi:LysR family nitrogen assimilation transcriptional regulator
MRLRQLETFIVVCELGSISRAAERLHVAQPALGLQIRGLEDEMGAQLLERHSRGVQPTPAGELVLQWATQTIRETKRIKEQVRSLSPMPSATVSLGLTPSIATAFALPILAAIASQLPHIRLRLKEALGSVLREWVRAEQVDLALVFDPVDRLADDRPAVLTERLYFITGVDGPGAGHGPISLAEVLDCPLAMALQGDAARVTVENAARAIGLALRIEYEAQSTGVMLKLVHDALATTVLPLAMAADGVRAGTLAARPIVSPELRRHLRWQQSPAVGENSAAHNAVRRIVEQALRSAAAEPVFGEAYSFAGAAEAP